MTMKMRLKVKNRLYRYDISRHKPSHGHQYIKHKICLSIMMVTCIKQQVTVN